uniref:intraflagellar transport protein 25 homolog isoform X3 n=1 Tax=Halichoerus grypus TaxID=9711 RepID=UPI001659231A|nr:intraflagellar transport protein 25 homolog isoform X3 [Halichoerus grypus]
MRKIDLCLSSEGTEVILATSSDEKHPPENIIDGNPETFWTTTGMFPQEFIICFHKHVRIERLVIQSYFDLVHTEGQLQNEEIMVPIADCGRPGLPRSPSPNATSSARLSQTYPALQDCPPLCPP